MKNFVRINGWPVAPAVAIAFLLMKAAHDAATGGNLLITSGYRTKSEQAGIFTARYARGGHSPWGDYRTYLGVSWGRFSGLGPVASPDVGSNHTRGFALDLNVVSGSFSQAWMLMHAHEYGFHWAEGRSVGEPWHWTWAVTGSFPTGHERDPWQGRGAPDPVYPSDPGMPIDKLGGAAAGGGGLLPSEPEEEDDDVKLIKNLDTGQIYSIAKEFIKQLDGGDGEHKAWVDAGLPGWLEVKQWSFDRIIRAHGIPEKVVNSDGHVLDSLSGQGKYVKYGSWSREQKIERFEYVSQKKR